MSLGSSIVNDQFICLHTITYMLHDMIIMEYAYHTQWGISSNGRAPA